MRITRRDVSLLLAGALAGRARTAGERFERRYRADAVILLLSMRIYSRAGVGSGYCFLEESGVKGLTQTKLGFAGGSFPDRTKGLNRLGFIHEDVEDDRQALQRARYFGFMTSSDEESFDEAKRSMTTQKDAIPVSAILGSLLPGSYQSRTTRLFLESGFNWSTWRRFLPRIGAALEGNLRESKLDTAPEPQLRTFLCTLSGALREKGPRWEGAFVYAGQRHSLSVEKEADRKAGERMRQSGLVRSEGDVWRASGAIHNAKTKKQTRFRVWYEPEGMPLPLRIELQPRSFLRLVFEADPSMPAQVFPEPPVKPYLANRK